MFAKAASADVLLVEYRLLPQHRFPKQVDDTVTVFLWLLESDYDASNIVTIGDSVGGSLALQMPERQKASNGGMPAAMIALNPIPDVDGGVISGDRDDGVRVSKR